MLPAPSKAPSQLIGFHGFHTVADVIRKRYPWRVCYPQPGRSDRGGGRKRWVAGLSFDFWAESFSMEGARSIATGVPNSMSSQLEDDDFGIATMSPLSRTITESTETIKGVARSRGPTSLLSTPSHQFSPRGDDFLSPTGTPGSHLPFTSLSPTIPPVTSATITHLKEDIAKDMTASSYVDESVDQSKLLHAQPPEKISSSALNPFDIAVQIQTEPGLLGWWKQTTSVLRESFLADRATLSVPSDGTEIENVPWAQLATFNIDNEENVSQMAMDAGSSRSSLSEILAQDTSATDKRRERDSRTSIQASSLAGSPSLATRPKLESRHSYAGYPIKYHAIHPENSSSPISFKRPRATRTRSQVSSGGVTRSRATAELKAEQLKRYDSEQSHQGPLSDDTVQSSGGNFGKVLDVLQPLDAEAEPLITPAGIVKVLNNSGATVLTRKYVDVGKEGSLARTSEGPVSSSKKSSPVQRTSTDQLSRMKLHAYQRNSTSSTIRNSKGMGKYDAPVRSQGNNSTYEDYEQIPGTPWAQSPSPSPAGLVEPDENPFFTDAWVVNEAFKKHPPPHEYGSAKPIEAIGLDRSDTVLQIPLVHPSASLSQPQQSHHLREDRRSTIDKIVLDDHGRKLPHERQRKVPLAILSILAPAIPYPANLVEALNRLSPVLATTFYAARQHSNLQKEVLGLSQRRARPGGRIYSREEKPPQYAGPRNLPAPSFVEPLQEESFSPLSTSTASSEYITATLQSPKNPLLPEAKTSSSGQDTSSESGREPRSKQTPITEISESYFPSSLSQEVSQEQSPPRGQPSSKGLSRASRSSAFGKPQVLHSQGATFHNTHPSLPTATVVTQPEQDESDGDETDGRPFKEPSSSLLRSMIDIGATQQFIAEPDSGKLLWVNSKFQAYRSSSSSQRLDDQLWDKIYSKDRKAFRKEWLSSLVTGEQLSQQLRLERFDGQYRWFHIKFLPLKDKFGLVKYWSGQAMDIHDLHEAQVKAAKSKERAASEAKYRAIANSLPVIVFAASVPTGMTFANTQWLSYSGQSLGEALGFGFLSHVHPDDLVRCRFPGAGDSGVLSPKILSAVEKHRASVVRTDSTASSTGESEGTAVADSRGGIRSARPSSPLSDLQIPNELLKSLAEDDVILCAKDGQGNLSITTELRLKAKDGQYRWHLVQGSYIESVDFGQGEAQWFIACTDISIQKQNEAKIQSTNSALESTNSALEEEVQRRQGYLSSMSHEIRTPLNGIIGNLQFLINSGLGESAGEWAHGAQEAAKGMHELINGILDLSKAEAKMLKLDMHWFNPRHLMEEIMDILNPRTIENKIELCHECTSDVPLSIRGDRGRVKQILVNLAGNAIKFTKSGEVIIQCDVLDQLPRGVELPELRDNELFIRWTIKDTGIGFSEEDKKLLFKAYSQIKSKSTRDIGGTGLGLALCKTMVKLHGGEIEAFSNGPGSGSTFDFFARFRVRKEPVVLSRASSHVGSPSIAGGPTLIPSTATLSPGHRTESPASMAGAHPTAGSPAILSDSSSIPSLHSDKQQRSVRSSVSTIESSLSGSPMKLNLPPTNMAIPRPGEAQSPPSPKPGSRKPPSKRGSTILTPPKATPLSPKPNPISAETTTKSSAGALQRKASPSTTDVVKKPDADQDPERSGFRPPMLSVLVVCPPESTRRITCNRIQYVAPRSTPFNITSVDSVDDAMTVLLGEEPILFTHVVLRLTVDSVLASCLQKILASPRHSQVCIVIVTDQGQQEALKADLPNLDFEALNTSDRVKIVFKPAHAYKLAKVFDPFSENVKLIGDPKEAKRQEEKRLQKESYALFKQILGGKGIRVLAVEDNQLQMNVSIIV